MLKESTRMIRGTVNEARRNGMISKNPTVAIDKTTFKVRQKKSGE